MSDLGRALPTTQARLELSLYCSDPGCVYCKELREVQERVAMGKFTVGSNHIPNLPQHFIKPR